MPKQVILNNEVEIRKAPIDLAVVKSLESISGIEGNEIMAALRYNVITPKQFSTITGLDISTILNMLREVNFKPKLNACYPFMVEKEKGPMFIIRDEDFENYLISFIKRTQK